MQKLITAVITTYKRELPILRRAVESVCSQTWRPLELFVVNDYPEDEVHAENIRKMLHEVEAQCDVSIRYLAPEHNSGACYVRNMGLEQAKGEYISFLDDDDAWLPNKLELQRKGFTSENVGMVYSPFLNIRFDCPDQPEVIIRGQHSGDLFEELLEKNVIGGTSMPLLRTAALRAIGGFDVELLSSQDYDVWIRIAQKYQIQFVSEPLTVRYLMEESITTNLRKKEQGWSRFTEKYWEFYRERKDVFSHRLKMIVRDTTAMGDAVFARDVMRRYKNYCNFTVYSVFCICRVKRLIKLILRK